MSACTTPPSLICLQYTFEQHPGNVESVNNLVPPDGAISGLPVHLEFRTCHFVFAPSSFASVHLAPVVVARLRRRLARRRGFVQGMAADLVQAAAHSRPGSGKCNSWQQLQINSPEQDYRVPYTNLIQYGQECAEQRRQRHSTGRLEPRRPGRRRSGAGHRSGPGHLAGTARRHRPNPGQGREDDSVRQTRSGPT